MGLIGINLISQQVQNQLRNNAKDLLTSDLSVSARRPISPGELVHINKIMQENFENKYELIDVYSMIRHEKTGMSRLVEIRSVENGFPFYGKFKLKSGEFQSRGLFISKDLASLWSVLEEDFLKVGTNTYKVLGIIQDDSSQGLRGFALAPRVYLPLAELRQSGLLLHGATGSFSIHYKLKPGLDSQQIKNLKNELIKGLTDRAVKVLLPEDISEQTGRALNYLTDFMSLTALIGLTLSLIGIFYLYQSHLIERLRDIGLIHLMGLSKFKIVVGLLVQFTLIFVLVLIAESFAVVSIYNKISPYITANLGISLSEDPDFLSVLRFLPSLYLLVLSILVPLLFSLLRTGLISQLKSHRAVFGKFYFRDFIPFIFMLWFFAVRLSHSYKTGSLFFGGLVLVLIISSASVYLLQFFLLKLLKNSLLSPVIESGIAFRNIVRSGSKLTLSFLSLTMGATLISLILQLDSLIQKEFVLDNRKPSLFVFDIQEDQIEDLKKFTQSVGTTLDGITPMIRARLEKINNLPVERVEESGEQTRDAELESRFRNRGINLTYRDHLGSAEKIVSGEPFPLNKEINSEGFVSLEKRFASRMKIKLGDSLTFDVQGIEVRGIVRNFREVRWTSFYPNFFVNFQSGYIDEAPKTYLAVINQGVNKFEYQRAVMDKFPNISFIDVEELIEKLSTIFEKSRQAIEFVSWLSLFVGMVILYGLSHDQVYRRFYDMALLKTLGLNSFQIRTQLLIEFGTIFLLAILSGFLAGAGMAILIGIEVFKISPMIDFMLFVKPFIGLSVMCLLTIILASSKAIQVSPRELLSDN
jgi:putative ABC transport system permease protein